jgi:hypothetical protein
LNKKIALSNFLIIHVLQSNLILIFLYHINRHMHCCIRTRRIGTKGKKEEKGWGGGGKKDWIEEGKIGKRTTGKEKKGKEGERDKGKGKGAEGKEQLGKRGTA